MGEIAEMMLNGLMCEGCGEFMDDHEEPGYPRRCAACAPRKPQRPQEIIRSRGRGRKKTVRPFRYSIGSKVVHAVNPTTGKSWCQFENNLARGNSAAFGGPPPIVELAERSERPYKKDCKNCAQLAAARTNHQESNEHRQR